MKTRQLKDIIKIIGSLFEKMGIFVVLILMIIMLSLAVPTFSSSINIINLLRQFSFIAIIALGAMCIFVGGGLDLSTGSVVGITSILVAMFLQIENVPLILVILFVMLLGALIGVINGSLVMFTGIPAFIATLGTMTILRGLALIVCKGVPVPISRKDFIFLGAGKILGIPVPILILVLLSIITFLIMNHTRFGRHVYAIGGNLQAAIISGIKIKKVSIIVYAYGSLLAAISGMVLTARIYSGQPSLGTGFELDAIAAAVIGGTSIKGGIGTVFGVISGALLIGVLSNGMDLINLSGYWQQVGKGIIITLAVIIDVLRKGKK